MKNVWKEYVEDLRLPFEVIRELNLIAKILIVGSGIFVLWYIGWLSASTGGFIGNLTYKDGR